MAKISYILNFVLFIALAGVLVFFLAGKGVNIDKRSISTSISNSYASSGSFSVGYIGGDYRGNWKVQYKTFSTNDADGYNDFMNSLSPLQFLMAKNTIIGTTLVVSYPTVATIEDQKTKKIVNGIEVTQ